jgi:hypothetical protein
MLEQFDNNTQIKLIEKIQEDVVYILECLVKDYTGEAKSELTDIVKWINSTSALRQEYRTYIMEALDKLLTAMRNDSNDRDARTNLIKIRHQLHNTLLSLKGEKPFYNYADVIEVAPPLHLTA